MSPNDYTVGWICALPIEMAAARAMLDVEDKHSNAELSHSKRYIFGSIMDHNIVIACLPSGVPGTTSTAKAVAEIQNTFGKIRFYLLVVVSHPTRGYGGVIPYDYGKAVANGQFEVTGTFNKPPDLLLNALSKLQGTDLGNPPCRFHISLSKVIDKNPEFRYPGEGQDVLFKADYIHPSGQDCSACDRGRIEARPKRSSSVPAVHYGLIASGNQVIKDAQKRDRIASRHDVLCFEMEAAGLDGVPCLVIRGISDYADSHKNDRWQHYAAAAAAAYAKEIFSHLEPPPPKTAPGMSPDSLRLTRTLEKLQSTKVEDDRSMLLAIKGTRARGTCEWLTQDARYMTWLDSQRSELLWVSGGPGKGKTMLAIYLTQVLEDHVPSEGRILLYYFCDNGDENRKSPIAILKSLLYQLLSNRPHLLHLVSTDLQGDSKLYSHMTLPYLWSTFVALLRSPDLSMVVCVVDGLDECEESLIKPFLGYLREFFTGQEEEGLTASFKLLLLSRESDNIKRGLGRVPRVDLESAEFSMQVANDVDKYISSMLQEPNVSGGLSLAQRERIRKTLRDGAEGTFLWVGFMPDILRGMDNEEIEDGLQEIPKGLDEIYQRILHQIPAPQKELVCLILHWVVLAQRPLTMEELEAAIRTDDKYKGLNGNAIIRQVKSCRPLLKIEHQVIHLVHQSAKEYLLSPDEVSMTYFGGKARHSILALSCLKYLETNYVRLSGLQEDTFLDYASTYWPVHMKNAGDDDAKLCEQSTKFFQESNTRDRWWARYWSREHGTDEPNSFKLLHLSAYFGLEALAQNDLRRKRRFTNSMHPANQKDSYGRIPLMWAAARGQKRMVELLLPHVFNIDRRDKFNMTALHLAVRGDHFDVVSLLLTRPVNLEIKAGGFTPLMVAIGNCSQSIVALLLKHGAKDPMPSTLGDANLGREAVNREEDCCETRARELIHLQPLFLRTRLNKFSEALTVPIALSLAISPVVAKSKACSSLLKRPIVKLIRYYLESDGEKVKAILDNGHGATLIEQSLIICRLQLGTRNKGRMMRLAQKLGDTFVEIILEVHGILGWWDRFAVSFLRSGFSLGFRDVLETWFTIGVYGTAKAIDCGGAENIREIWQFGVKSCKMLLIKEREAEAIAVMRWVIMSHVIAREINKARVIDTISKECTKAIEDLTQGPLTNSFISCMSTAWSREILYRVTRKESRELKWTLGCFSAASFVPKLPLIAGTALFKTFTTLADEKADMTWLFVEQQFWPIEKACDWAVNTATWHIEAAIVLLQLISESRLPVPQYIMGLVPSVLKRAEMEALSVGFNIGELKTEDQLSI
ncbi:hypothetical protein BDV38DRAFT_281520 [Aspergillus pseudotamarii]|uniref:NACHT domain-containing protein n=1 Tax=Aspergillus pseudotamarii TaxID=132259 RepID=A0A5N6SYY7_ASPPS|nr:uncharacterized protein BDV38DRAFT_281520 [Aspergillus pseudotamarii]KAE8138960.1 hypothetical protein BDV38DRAFT_281520 [Aspergillus pseudotamarii]